MKKTNYVLAMVSLSVLVMTGCGWKKVTAQSLIDGLRDKETNQVADVQLTLNMDIQSEMEEADSSNTKMTLDSNMKSNANVAHMSGTTSFNTNESDWNQPIDIWYDFDAGKVYSYDAYSEQWQLTEMDEQNSKAQNMANFSKLSSDAFTDLKLTDNKADGFYIVTGKVNFNTLQEAVESVNFLTVMSPMDEDVEEMIMEVTMKFDHKTKELKSILCAAELSSIQDFENATVHVFQIGMEFIQLGGSLDLTIPESAITGADDEIAWEEDAEDFDESDWEEDDWNNGIDPDSPFDEDGNVKETLIRDDLEIVKEYTWVEEDAGTPTTYYIVVARNLSSDTVILDSTVTARDAQGEVLGTTSDSYCAIAQGQVGVLVHIFEGIKDIESFDEFLQAGTDYFLGSAYYDTECTAESTSDSVEITFTNNSTQEIPLNRVSIIYLKGDEAVGYSVEYLGSITPGTHTYTAALPDVDFDSIDFYSFSEYYLDEEDDE